MSEIHEKTNIFKVYNGDTKDVNRVVGVTDEMTLPNFENLTEKISNIFESPKSFLVICL